MKEPVQRYALQVTVTLQLAQSWLCLLQEVNTAQIVVYRNERQHNV